MPAPQIEKTPGPQYFPGDRPDKRQAPKFTMGVRRNKGAQDVLKNQTSTPGNVGPARYAPEACSDPSNRKTLPKWTLPKAPRGENRKKLDRNQTYDTRSGFNKQATSKNRTGQSCHFGTAGRAVISKMGTFKDSYTGAMKVKMPHNYLF